MMIGPEDNFLNDDFDRFLDNWEENSSRTAREVDELSEFFQEDEDGENTPSRVSFISLPSKEEIQDIFGEENERPEESGVIKSVETDWDELEALLEDDTAQNSVISAVNPLEEAEKAPEFYIPTFYSSLEELEEQIDRDISLVPPEPIDFARLEALLNSPASRPEPVEEEREDFVIESEGFLEDEFQDLEKLLSETNQAMGGVPATTGGLNNRIIPRSRNTKAFEQTMRVPIKQLDNLSNLIGELVVKRNRLEQDQERLRTFLDNLLNQVQNLSEVGGRMQDLYERTLLEGALLASRGRDRWGDGDENVARTGNPEDGATPFDLQDIELDRFTDFHLHAQDMIELIVRVRESASDIQFVVDETDQVTRTLRQATTQLQEGMTKSRMVPFAQTADRLPRAIRDISLKLNKQARLQVEGRDVLIDKMILEHLNSPMTHLVNNAITHGIESPRLRQEAGKPAEGTITVRAFLQGNQTVITVSDDGAGIDANRVKAKAIEKRLITAAEARVMTPQEVYELLFHAGFSTKDKADDFAGRGVGLDVVRTSLSEVRGTVSIDSVIGRGTTFTVRLPLTLSICKALPCVSDRALIGFSMDGVEEIKEDFPLKNVKVDSEGRNCIPWYNTLLPFQPLNELLTYNRQIGRGSIYGAKQEDDSISIVILRAANSLLAVQVDRVLKEEEIVIKQIDGPIPRPPGIAGATVMGDGTVMPIGDVLELIDIANGRLKTDSSSPWRKVAPILEPEESEHSEPMVLIVDDSITVRELLSLSFSKAGYRVEQARDGQDAWDKLRGGLPCDIVFCDIEMPRINGLELLANLQNEPRLADIPVALLTSRGADRHRQVAAKLGASGYFTKPYTEKDLIDAAGRMIAGEVLLPNSSKKSRKKPAPVEVTEPEPFKDDYALDFSTNSDHKVLIIDDSVMVREMLSMSFTKGGYRIEQARDGQEAWEKLRGGLRCDLILCDIEMPRMNGLELLSRIQEDERLKSIPIAMITSRGARKMQNLAAEKGAKGYFVKPYIEDILLDAARRLIAGEVLLEKNSFVE